MATAKKTTVKREVKVIEEVPVYTLELSELEAKAVMAVFSHVGGARNTTLRGYVNGVAVALKRAGIETGLYTGSIYESVDGSLFCNDLPASLRPVSTLDTVEVF